MGTRQLSEQDQQAQDSVVSQTNEDAYISPAGESMVTAEETPRGFLISSYEWGQNLSEVSLDQEAATELRDWLIGRVPL